jgi:predicted O-methyltransferase YrrM
LIRPARGPRRAGTWHGRAVLWRAGVEAARRAEKEGFSDYLKKLLPLVRKGGLIVVHDSTGEAHLMRSYFQAIAANPDLETVFVDASPWGMAVTHKMR